MKNETFLVYVHTCNINSKKYVGITSKTLDERSRKYGNGYCKNKEFYADIQKYGWDNITHEVLEVGLSEEEARKLEQYYIALWDTTNPEFGYNQSKGGEKPTALGKQLTEEHKHKISQSQKGKHPSEETRRKRSESLSGEKNPMFGKQHKEESKHKMGQNHKDMSCENNPMFGKQHKKESRKRMSEAKRGENNPSYGTHWYNNGNTELRAFECPAGFTRGRLKRA